MEDAIRKAISLGGDSDTMGCIAGAIGEAYYGGVPAVIAEEIQQRIPEEFRKIVEDFYQRYEL